MARESVEAIVGEMLAKSQGPADGWAVLPRSLVKEWADRIRASSPPSQITDEMVERAAKVIAFTPSQFHKNKARAALEAALAGGANE